MNIPRSNLDELMKDPKAAGLLKNNALLQSIMNAPDTQRLMQMLDRQAGGELKQAAQGDAQALSGLVRQVMGSEEGARLIRQLNQKLEQNK